MRARWKRLIPPRRLISLRRSLRLLLTTGALSGLACSYMPTQPKPTVAVSGRISDHLGRPLSGVDIFFIPAAPDLGSWYAPQRATTDSAGAYSMQLVAGDWRVNVFAPDDILLADPFHDFRITVSPQNSRFDLVFQGFRVQGRVIAPTGATLDSATVLAISDTPSEFGNVVASTRYKNGIYSFFLPAGSYDFSGYPDEYASGYPNRRLNGISVAADTTIDIVLQGELLEGLVTGPDGMPLEGALVTASGQGIASRIRTGADGRYALYAPPGNYRFICDPNEGYILDRISAVYSIAGPTTHDFDLSGTEWTGTVRSSATNLPIPGVSAVATLFADSYNRAAVAKTEGAGQFRLVLEPNREYSLTFSESGMIGLTIPSIFAAADTTFDIVLDPTPTP